ncbi:MAG: hypothetical protein DRJ61_15285 [Acidobacteria bacterium]|nr:MAG: hypothetical protein DRJ61_15285 [Acidobacteriota bacterium]
MEIWFGVLVVVAVILVGGMVAISRYYRTPQVVHRRDPGFSNIPFDEIRFSTDGGKTLYGWWIPSEGSDRTLVLVHGWGRNVERVLPFVREFHPAGYNLIAFDARSHGSSNADGTANMLKFSADIQAALDEVERRGADPEALGVVGLSVGGAAAIHAAAHDRRIRAVITVGAFAHPGDLMRAELQGKGIPAIIASAVCRYAERSIGARLDIIAPEKQIRGIEAPVLLVHGENDIVVPVDHGRRLAAAGSDNVELLVLSGRGHSDCNDDELFWPRVKALLDRAFRP